MTTTATRADKRIYISHRKARTLTPKWYSIAATSASGCSVVFILFYFLIK